MVTPFHADGSLNLAAVPAMVEFHIDAGVGGFYLCGNTGEGKACTVDERKLYAKAVVDATAKVSAACPSAHVSVNITHVQRPTCTYTHVPCVAPIPIQIIIMCHHYHYHCRYQHTASSGCRCFSNV